MPQRLFAELAARLAEAGPALPDKPEEGAEPTLRALWLCAAGQPCSVARAAAAPLPALDEAGQAALRALVERRLAGVPLAHLTGRQSFMGLELLAGPEALIPRQETELLGHAALDILQQTRPGGQALVLDICTGSGNLALALAAHSPAARVFGADISPEAVALAERNSRQLQLAGRVAFRCGDLFGPFEADFQGQADLIACNPPYISSAQVEQMPHEIADFEPRQAFDAGPFGVGIVTRVIREAPRFLKAGGWLCFEVGRGQGPALSRVVQRTGAYAQVITRCDTAGDVRVLMAHTPAQGVEA